MHQLSGARRIITHSTYGIEYGHETIRQVDSFLQIDGIVTCHVVS